MMPLMTGMISPPPLMMPGVPQMPMFSPQGGSSPGQQHGSSSLMSDPTMVAYQQSLQRAFLQSAMAQNIQIQQQLLAQNQALQTLLQTQANSPNASGQSGSQQGQTPVSVVSILQTTFLFRTAFARCLVTLLQVDIIL